MFCDLVGSTDLSGRLDAEDLRTVVRAYQEAAAGAIERHEGYIAQYLGDGLLVYFGYPQAHENDAEHAVRAGLDILTALGILNERLLPQHGVRLAARVGVHTGPVVIGEMGGGPRSEVLALGDTTNIAARVQGAAEPDTVVITAATQRLVGGLFVVEERGAEQLKGVAEPVALYRVVQPSGVRSRLDVSAGRHTPFVGRQTELGVLRDAWERVVEGQGQTVLVQGEAGLGKSRLCYELRERLTGEPHTWLECRCSPYTSGTAFRPVIELVEQALSFQAADTPAEKLAKLGAGLLRGGFAADEAGPLLAEWLELPESAGYTPLEMSPDSKRRRTLETLAAWNLKLGELQPIVVLVEDLHWCDPSSLELLGRLVAQSATARVLLVGTARPEFASPWPARSNLQTLTLGRLARRQAREMIAAVVTQNRLARHSGESRNPEAGLDSPTDWTPAPDQVRGGLSAGVTEGVLSEAVIDALVARADGIPLFAEELTQAVVEAGGEPGAAAIPMTLQDSLLARLDRLSSAKEVAQRAAVLGREFSYALLAATAGLDEGSLQQGLSRLVEAEIVFARGVPPEATYTFKHALVQEAAYESLLKQTRQQLHSRVVDVLVAEFPERVAVEPELVARHAEAAGRINDAITQHQRAGEQAQAGSAHEEAIGHLRNAIALLATPALSPVEGCPESGERDTREVVLQLALGASLAAARGFSHSECEGAYDRARILCEAVGDARRLGLALIGLAVVYITRGETERGRGLAAQVLSAAEHSGDRELAAHGHIQIATAQHYQGNFDCSLAHCEEARALYDPDRQDATAYTFATPHGITSAAYTAWNLWVLGWPDPALTGARETVELARRLDHPFSLAFSLVTEMVVHWLRRDVTAQRDRAAETMALSEAQGFPLWLGVGRAFHAATRVAADKTGAVADLLAGLTLSAETGNQSGAPALFVLLGEAYVAAGQLDEARGAVDTGLAIAAQTGQRFFDAELHRLQGEIVLSLDTPVLSSAEGRPADATRNDRNQREPFAPSSPRSGRIEGTPTAEAQACFRRALDIAREQQARLFELRAATSLARLWRDQGKRAEAHDLLAPIYAWFTEGFDTRDLVDAKALLEEL
jgi:class 3 adenylate cyclase/tetratricopeptide (TPR) repeat protein